MPSLAFIASSLRVTDENLLFERICLLRIFSLLLKELFYIFCIIKIRIKYTVYCVVSIEIREFKNPIKKLVLAHSILNRIFKFHRNINPVFQMGRLINSI